MQIGERVLGRFQLEAEAGAGAMGVVYRARDLVTGRLVAVKALRWPDVEAAQRFAREGEVLEALHHRAIVEHVAHGLTPAGEPFLVMEWLEGASLKELHDARNLSFVEAIDVAAGISGALVVAHARGIVHRDLKPGNVFLVGRSASAVKVLDFGIARLRGAGTLTGSGAALGTPAFMSPEQASGARELDGRSDLFSLGAILFSVITGRAPFESSEPLAMLLAVTTRRAALVGSIAPATPPRLAALVDALLEPRPSDRPPDAAAVVRLLEGARAEALALHAGAPTARPSAYAVSAYAPTASADRFEITGPPTVPDTLEALPAAAIGSSRPPAPLASGGPGRVGPTLPGTTFEPSARPLVASTSAPPSASPRSWRAPLAAFVAVLALGGGALGAYFALTSNAPPTARAKRRVTPSDDATAAAAPRASGGGFAWCPVTAVDCALSEVGDRHHADPEKLVTTAIAKAKALRSGAELVGLAGNGLTDAGLDLDLGGQLNAEFTRGISVIATGEHVIVYNAVEVEAARRPPCSLTDAYKAARAAGLPGAPSAWFVFGEHGVIFTVSGTPQHSVTMSPSTCEILQVVPRP